MLALGLSLVTPLASLPALSGNAPPPLPAGWAFLMLGGAHVLFEGDYLIAEVR
jgi:hypothetical protein